MVLSIPDSGLQLESSAKAAAALPLQAFALTLSDSVIEDMINCVQNGQDIQLSLGGSPTLLYGSSTHHLSPSLDTSAFDLYFTDPSESSRKAERLPNPTMSIFRKPEFKHRIKQQAPRVVTVGGPKKVSNGLDKDIEALQSSLAAHNAEKLENATRVIDAQISTKRGGMKGGKAASKSKLLPAGKSAMAAAMSSAITRSVPSSPALSGVGSPSLGPSLSASQQASQQAKEQRSPIVHELAVKERSYDELWKQWPGDSEKDFKTALDKVADFDDRLQKYVMKKIYWKELDVYKYKYSSGEQRKQAIDNAIKQFDKMRLGETEPEWQKLLPKEERGKGKCLSKLQAVIAKGPPQPPVKAPKITVQDAEDSSAGSSKNGDSDEKKKSAAKGGAAMERSSSQPIQAKAKKVSEREAQAKRLLSNSKKPAAPKVSPTKASAKGGKPRILSKEFISDSDDSSSEEAPLSTTVPKSKPVVEKARDTPPPKPKPLPRKEITKPQVTALPPKPPKPSKPVKRPIEDDDSSSSSGTPLSKRFKGREIKAAPPVQKPHRTSDVSQGSRATSSGMSFAGNGKSKNTSPTKSSPLASSPPTNASDLEQNEPPINNKKRKADHEREREAEAKAASKRQRLSQDLMSKAYKFKVFYQKYEALHKEIVGQENPPEHKMMDLLEMRERLQTMKTEIYREIPPEH